VSKKFEIKILQVERRLAMGPYDEQIRRSLHETRVESLRSTMIAATYAAGRARVFTAKLERRLVPLRKRLDRRRDALAARTSG
jgi:hypothetical protein